MKKLIALCLLSIVSVTAAFAQKDLAQKAMRNENFRNAASLYRKVVASEPTGENFYSIGKAYASMGNWDSARYYFDQGIKADPKFGPNYAGMGSTFLSQNNTSKAQEYFDMAQKTTSKKDIAYYQWVADAYLSSASPNPQEAVNQLKKAVDINYKNGVTYLMLGDAYAKLMNGGDAVNNYNLALQYDPTLIQANVRTGDVWTDARRYPESLAAYQKALAVDADYAPALKGLANLYFATGQYDKAKETFEHYMRVSDPTDESRYRYAQILFLTKDYAGVQNIANELLKRDTTKVNMYRWLAYSAYETGNYQQGLQLLNNFMRRTDTTKYVATDYEYLGKLQRKLGNDSLAAAAYQRAVRKDTSMRRLYDTLAVMSYAKKKYGAAATYYEMKLRSTKKPTIQDYFALGRAYYFDSAYRKADTAFMHVTEISPTWPQGYLWRARANLSLDNPNKPQGLALPHYQKVIETAAGDSVKYKRELVEAYKYIGNLNTVNEKYDDAMTYYNKVLALNPDDADVKQTIEAIKESRKKKGK